MTDKVIQLVPQAAQTPEIATVLASLDDLRDAVLTGKIKAFAAVGLAADHTTFMWSSFTQPTTRLEILGAISTLQHQYRKGL